MPSIAQPLSVADHRRDISGMTYVYPVVSRRAGGVSVGINLIPNNACNWRCIYCQVPNLVRGGLPPLDLTRLAAELRQLLDEILNGDFMARWVPEDCRVLSDIAFSGNGEPTSAPEFARAVASVETILKEFGVAPTVKIRLITNGSLLDRKAVREGIARIGDSGGEVWFKVDAATTKDSERINGTRQKPDSMRRRLLACAELCETWVQSCFFALDGREPDQAHVQAYLDFLAGIKNHVAGVHLYGVARESQQPDAERLKRLPAVWFENMATRLRDLGLTVKVSP